MPEIAVSSLLFRLVATATLFIVYGLLRWHKLGERFPEALMCIAVLIPQIHYLWIMPQSGSALAYFFAGYAVMIYGYAALIPGRMFWVIIANSLSVTALSISLVAFNSQSVPFDPNAILVFAATMLLAGIVSSSHSFKLHYKQFQAKQELLTEKAVSEDLLTKLEQVSRLDPLTNLANRRYWNETLDEYWQTHQTLSLAIIDIDYFKQVNDVFGHKAGDDVIVELANILQRNVANNGFCARLGGDEFAVVLSGNNHKQHTKILSNIMRLAKAMKLIDYPKAKVSLSIGVALKNATDQKPSELMQRADKQLYKAKANRNAIVIEGQDHLDSSSPLN